MGDKTRHYPLIFIQKNTVTRSLCIRNLHRHEYANPVDTVQIGTNAVVEDLHIEDLFVENHTDGACAKLVNSGTLKKLRASCLREDEIQNEGVIENWIRE